MSRPSRPRPALFRALGRAEPPVRVEIDGERYELDHVYKHDSWAATARYRGASGMVVCKLNRIQPILGLPMRWLGKRLARREAAFLRRLDGLAGVPAGCGTIRVEGRLQEHAVAHAYVPGEPLRSRHKLNDHFFTSLRALLAAVHFRGIAYVDLHKRENILVGQDGAPHLIDFQVCFGVWSKRWANTVLGRQLLKALQDADWYHLAKHVTRHRPDQAGLILSLQAARPWWIQAHRVVAVPLRQMRRRLLAWLGVRQHGGRAETETFPEEAVRQARQAA
jgi:hypothetical protein